MNRHGLRALNQKIVLAMALVCSATAVHGADPTLHLLNLPFEMRKKPTRLPQTHLVNVQHVQPIEVPHQTHCADPEDTRPYTRSIGSLTLSIDQKSEELPDDCFANHFPGENEARYSASIRQNVLEHNVYWAASGLVHNPLYFEDVALERYGHGHGGLDQPLISTVRFYRDVLILPYRIGLDPPRTLNYALGYDRPGSWAESVSERLPWSWRGAISQAGAVTGFGYLFP